MENNFKKYAEDIKNKFVELNGGSYAHIDTGEIWTESEVRGYQGKMISQYREQYIKNMDSEIKSEFNLREEENKKTTRRKPKKKTKTQYKSMFEFNKVFRDRIEVEYYLKMDKNEKLLYFILRDFIQPSTNCIIVAGEIPTTKTMEKLVSLSSATLNKALDGLEEKGMFKRVQAGRRKAIYVNPEYYSGGYVDDETLAMFGLLEVDEEKVSSQIEHDLK